MMMERRIDDVRSNGALEWDEQASTIAALKEQLAGARNVALEEAARTVEIAMIERKDGMIDIDPEDKLYFYLVEELAAAIRALASQPAAPVAVELPASELSNDEAHKLLVEMTEHVQKWADQQGLDEHEDDDHPAFAGECMRFLLSRLAATPALPVVPVQPESNPHYDHILQRMSAPPVQPESAYSVAVSIRASQGWKIDGGPVPILYTDEINGQQVCRDDVFLCKTEHLTNHAAPPVQQPDDVREAFEAWAKREGHTNLMRMAGDPDQYDDLILRANYKGYCAALATTRPGAAQAPDNGLIVWAEEALDLIESVTPERNCSCHISPPCNDCVEWSHHREVSEKLRAAILAASGGAEQVVAEGYVMVPVESTPEMVKQAVLAAANFRYNSTGMQGFTHADAYRAMIAAAPAIQSNKKEG